MSGSSSREILQVLFDDGWLVKAQHGSHVQLVHPTKRGKVTVPHPREHIPIGTVRSIMEQAQIRLR